MAKNFLEKMYTITNTTTSDEIKSIYDEWAKDYDHDLVDDHAYAMPARAAAMAARCVTDLSSSVLDVGCGTGLSGLALRHHGFTCLDGCDLSPNMLAIARDRSLYDRLFEVDLLAPPMDVNDNHYDLTIAVGAFATGHLGGPAVDELCRITRQGGTVIITTNDPFYETGILQATFERLLDGSLITDFTAEHGDHIPGKNIGGWVFAFTKS